MLPTNTVAATDLKYDGSPTGNIYRYDQVGRLRTDEFVSAVPQTGSYSWQVNTLKEYNSSYVYDENGNLQALNRNGYPLPGDVVNMDRITYNYGAGVTQGNRLQSVSDGGTMDYPAAPAVRDIRGTQATNNYQYDAQGRLKQDLQESLEYVWLPNGKIGEVKKNGVVKVRFLYDAEGNRVRKTEYNPNGSVAGSTYYVYGEDGSVAAVYRQQGTGDVYLSEVPLYGAGRLGMMTFPADASTRHCPTCVQSEDFAAGVKATRRVGAKLYELTDHLGNVRAVVGDVKLPDG
ncbi:MAG: hypothetical protein JNL32_05465, partial [Candidatus Kapabacteria bacterium]|nr:hypothetical protein [Candidatus Kapabacteria bacterium]